MDTKGYAITKLSGNNYFLWQIKLKMILQKEKLWNIITKDPPNPITEEWETKDQSALATIGLTLEDKILVGIANCKTAREAWSNLKSKYKHKGLTSKLYLLKKLYGVKYADYQSMEDYIDEIMELNERLRSIGENVKENHLVAILLCGLPETYNPLITTIETRDEMDLKVDYVCEKLRDEAVRQGGNNDDNYQNDLAMSAERKKMKGTITCHACGKTGHIRRHCPTSADSNPTSRRTPHSANHANTSYETPDDILYNVRQEDNMELDLNSEWAMSGQEEEKNKSPDIWIIDSGATAHMCNNIKNLVNIEEIPNVINIITANGETLTSNTRGTRHLRLQTNNDLKQIELKNVLFVPKLKHNLLSVPALCKDKYTMAFDGNSCQIYKDGLIGEGEMQGKTYTIKSINPDTEKSLTCMHTWHRRFGHRDLNCIKYMDRNNLVNDLKIKSCNNEKFCQPCKLGKMTQHSFKPSTNHDKIPFSTIVTDLCGPIKPATARGYKYFLTLTDDCSNFTEIALMKQKSDTSQCVINYVNRGFNHFKRMPKIIRSDGGGEYSCEKLQSFMLTHGILHQKSVPMTPQQNGKSERKNRTLLDMTRCMIKDKGLPLFLWGEAINMAVYLHNRFKHSTLDCTPYEKWFGIKPTVKHLKYFGQAAYAFVPKQLRDKLGSTSVRGYMVGYGFGVKAYRIWVPGSQTIINSISVDFEDDECDELHTGTTNLKQPDSAYIEVSSQHDSIEPPAQNDEQIPRRSQRINKGIAATKWTC